MDEQRRRTRDREGETEGEALTRSQAEAETRRAGAGAPAGERSRTGEHAAFPITRRAGEEETGLRLREDDLEPHEGLRYIARLFKVLSVLLILLLIGEVVIGLMQEGRSAAVFLMIEATRLIVFAGLLWGAGDIALLLIESNHDLRATRILAARLVARVDALLERTDGGDRDRGS
ncbi:MAG: hypothetical protein ACRELV_00125 [Longimicrobiales bacterium]